MDWLLENLQTVINWVLAGGFTVTTGLTILKTIGQTALNKKFDQLKTSINLESAAVTGITKITEEIIKTKQIFDTEVQSISREIKGVTGLIHEFMESPILTEDLLPKLTNALCNVELMAKAINYKDETIQRYAEDLRTLRIDIQKLQNRGV